MIRVAAVGDLHFGTDSSNTLRPHLERLHENADVFLLAGDLTRQGDPAEGDILAKELRGLPVPTFAVLGNHDYHLDREQEITGLLGEAGVKVLEGEGAVVEVNGSRVGIAGSKGFGGGFAGASGSDFGEPEMKLFIRVTQDAAERLEKALADLQADVRVALLHYAPVKETLVGEPPEIYPFLGSYLLAEAIDRAGADLVLHGHAHRGVEKGSTPGGIHVRNVAVPVIQRTYNVYELGNDVTEP
jgi:Icc-related predicted phosphoesterase